MATATGTPQVFKPSSELAMVPGSPLSVAALLGPQSPSSVDPVSMPGSASGVPFTPGLQQALPLIHS